MTTQTGAQMTTTTDAERRAKHDAEARAIFGDDTSTTVDLPGLGPTRIVYKNQDLSYIERMLTPLLDSLPEADAGRWVIRARGRTQNVEPHTDGATFERWVNVWDALESIGNRYPMESILHLLAAGIRHVVGSHAAAVDVVDDMPPRIFNDPKIERVIEAALVEAFGDGVGPTHPPVGDVGATPEASTG